MFVFGQLRIPGTAKFPPNEAYQHLYYFTILHCILKAFQQSLNFSNDRMKRTIPSTFHKDISRI